MDEIYLICTRLSKNRRYLKYKHFLTEFLAQIFNCTRDCDINLWKTLYKILVIPPTCEHCNEESIAKLVICMLGGSEVHLTLFLCIYYFLKTIPS